MTNEKELREEFEKEFCDEATIEKGWYTSIWKESAKPYEVCNFFLSKFHSHTQEVVEKIMPKVQKFIDKVESGKARSVETYADMKEVRDFLALLKEDNK